MADEQQVKRIEDAIGQMVNTRNKVPGGNAGQQALNSLAQVPEGATGVRVQEREKTVRELHADLAEALTNAQILLNEIHKRMG